MKRKKRKALSQCTIAVLSASMVMPGVMPAFSAFADVSVRQSVRQATVATSSEAPRNDLTEGEEDFLISDGDILDQKQPVATPSEATPRSHTKSKSYPAYGTAAFWDWYSGLYEARYGEEEDRDAACEAYDNAMAGWYEEYVTSPPKATASDAEKVYPEFDDSFDPDSSQFWAWFYEAAIKVDADGNLVSYKDSVILDWIVHSSYEDVVQFFEAFHLLRQATVLSVIGNLWPDGYGSTGNLYSNGSGTEDSPYIIDSVEDLRTMAAHIAIDDRNEDTYYLIKNGTYDLNGSWIPIGFPVNDGGKANTFKGHLAAQDGANIKNLGFNAYTPLGITTSIAEMIRSQESLGFFGEIGAGATVTNLYLDTGKNTIQGTNYAGILAGRAVDASIKECTVVGAVKGIGYVGGIVGIAESSETQVDDRNMIIEDCSAKKAAVYTTQKVEGNSFCNGHSCVGGIVGFASNTTVMDTSVSTNTAAGDHIYGNGAYVGGIAGVIENSDVYNAYVSDGNIGESNAYAVGGIIGGYNGGQVKVARFAGTVVRPTSTNNYSACFIGSRVNGAGFTYGSDGNIAYLFTDAQSKADTGICGARIEDDGVYDDSAHIGYWHSADSYYTLCAGSNVNHMDNYFYEELEEGILNIKRSGQKAETVNHYTADKQGRPTRGYLLALTDPTVDGVKAADISAYINGTYKPVVTSENLGAFAAGDVVYLSFADRSDGSAYYQMTDKAQNPFYSYYRRDPFRVFDPEVTVAGVTKGAGYYFTFPESDVTVGAEYKRVSQSVTTDPNKIVFELTQIRNGSRENPTIEWYATAYDRNKDISGDAHVITDVDGRKWENIKLATIPAGGEASYYDELFQIDSLVNGESNNEFDLLWQTGNDGDTDIVSKPVSTDGNMEGKKAYITLNVVDSALADKVKTLEEEQAAGGYKDSLTTSSPYWYHSLVTATAQVKDSDDKLNPPKGYTDIDIKLNIRDNTNVSINAVALSRNSISYDVVRTLTGSRRNPTVNYKVNGASPDSGIAALSAVFQPDYFTNDDVSWYLSGVNEGSDFETDKGTAVPADKKVKDDGTIKVSVSGNGDKAYYNAAVQLKGITTSSCDNAALSPIIIEQDRTYTSQMQAVPDAVSTYQKYVKVTAEDTNNNHVTDTCKVIVTFHTEDETEILPESVQINGGTAPDGSTITGAANIHGYNIIYTFSENKNSNVISRKILIDNSENTFVNNGQGEKVKAVVSPEYDNSYEPYQPYDNTVIWSLSNTSGNTSIYPYDVLKIDTQTGQITVRGYGDSTDPSENAYSPWINSLIAEGKLENATVPIRIIAKSARDNSLLDYKDINVTFSANTIENGQEDGVTFDLVLTKENATSLSDTGIVEKESWSGTEPQKVKATATGTSESPSFTVFDKNGNLSTDVLSITDPLARSVTTEKNVAVKTDAGWIKNVVNNRVSSNQGTEEMTVRGKTANGIPLTEFPVIVNFRYDGTDMTAGALNELPEGYAASPDVITSDTPNETYDMKKASVKDRQITMDVVATQGNYSINNPGTRKWSFGIVQLSNTTYSSDGVKRNDATYKLSGDIKDYCRIDPNGYLVPIKGCWEDLIEEGDSKGTVIGVVTAQKDIDGKITSDSYKVEINFRYDKAVLNSHEEVFQVVYTQDSRTNFEKSHWSGDEAMQLKAHISDESGKDVTPVWESSDESLITVDSDGRVYVNKSTWMEEIINNVQKYGADVHEGTRTATITAKHPVSGATADTCKFTVSFRYDQAILETNAEVYDLILTQTSRTVQPSVKWSGNDARQLNAKVYLEAGANNTPYWSTDNGGVMHVDVEGRIEPVTNADWQKEIMAQHKFSGQKKATINVENMDQTVKDSCNVTIHFKYENVELSENEKVIAATITASGNRSNPTYEIKNYTSALNAVLNSATEGETKVLYSSANREVVHVDAEGNLLLVIPETLSGTAFTHDASPLIKKAIEHPFTEANPYVSTEDVIISALSEDGRMADQCNLKIRLTYIDNTYSSSGGGSGGGSSSGGGGGSSSKGVSPGGSTSATAIGLPAYVLRGGMWTQNALGKWFYSNGRTYTNEWAAVQNPYADVSIGQPQYDWFRFGADSAMITGWYIDESGDTYFLHDRSDNTLGHMYVGWQWIDDDQNGSAECYYFETESTGYRGRLYKNTVTTDGYKVNEKGQWITEQGIMKKQM